LLDKKKKIRGIKLSTIHRTVARYHLPVRNNIETATVQT